MAKRKYKWLTLEISSLADQITKKVAKQYNVSQAKVLGVLVTLEIEKLQRKFMKKKKRP